MVKKDREEKVVVIFIEGETEIEFYKRLVNIMRAHCGGRLTCSVEPIDASGIGKYKNKVLRIFEKRIKTKHPNGKFYIALCYDQDVFEMTKNPPINWQEVKRAFLDDGATDVRLIKAVHSLEDWFLCDAEGVFQYLNLPANTKLPNGNGYERLKVLFKKGKKIYIKGKTNGDFVKALNMEKILLANCSDISPLCKLLGVDCKHQKRCRIK
ncbi:MAG: hypothetical protein HFJ86_12490 [Oscillospiraceae bacterium]|jgi:hypothetical protein|nr:hypothetical protein [Oscillospiraceae bacterium]